MRRNDVTIHPARYAKNMMAVHCASDGSGWKTQAMRLCDALNGRWSNRERAYIMSPTKARRLEQMLADGWDATTVLRELIPPTEVSL